jgi:hypothetical protein
MPMPRTPPLTRGCLGVAGILRVPSTFPADHRSIFSEAAGHTMTLCGSLSVF